MQNLYELIQKITGLYPEAQTKLLISVLIILILWLIRFLILKIVWRRSEDVRIRYLWKKTLTYVVSLLGLLLIVNVWIQAFRQLGTFLGLLSAGLAIALKDLVENIAGWLFIIARRPFTIGDRIQIGNYAGDIIDMRVFQFTLMEIGNWVDADQSTGRVIHIPNGKVFTDILANYSKGFQYIWNEIPVLVTFESNWKKARNILLQIARTHTEHLSKSAEKRIKEASKRYMIFHSHLAPIVYTSVKNSGVLLTIRYLCEPRKRRSSEHAIWEDILQEFAKYADIDFAYPTERFYNYQLEKKTENKQSNKENAKHPVHKKE
ncbi:MAG: mechanosensitive ion channel [Candidatus Cloacimonadota bacterium]|nr:mechanosensitive ion channel [Candidatus Cloacimonadota bacterium]